MRVLRTVRLLFRRRRYQGGELTRILNPAGAKCPCAKSISVFCPECEGNRK